MTERKLDFFCSRVMTEKDPSDEKLRFFHFKGRFLHPLDFVGNVDCFSDNYIRRRTDLRIERPIMSVAMIKRLREVEGIESVEAWSYGLVIEIAVLYEWEEVEEKIKRIISWCWPLF